MTQELDPGLRFAQEYEANRAKLIEGHAYDPAEEHDNCGVGMIVAIDGKARRSVVELGVEALKAVWHRGAVDADGKTGDGAGIHIEIPQDFFRAHIERQGVKTSDARLGVGMIFLPRNDLEGQERCRTIVETEILKMGYGVYGWRQVPIDSSVCGEKANASRPEIEQVIVQNTRNVDDDKFELDLYVIRRRIEKQALAENLVDFYICTLSCRSIIYKGMFLAEVLSVFYPDLTDERFVSTFAIYHQRYSTNTFPMWKLAQPFRTLAHNGEINTVRGNVNWMKSHETRMAHERFGQTVEDIKPVVQPGSDSAQMDNVFELLIRGGRELPMVKTMMMPQSWSYDDQTPQSIRNMYAYANSVMEAWDGPAAIACTDGNWVLAGMDRNGLRPCRYTITGDGLLVVGSETGMVKVDEVSVVEKGRVGPGQMIAVDMRQGRFYRDPEIKDWLAKSRPFGDWTRNITVIDQLVKADAVPKPELSRDELRRRMLTVGWTLEDLELILHPMVEDAKEAVGSMGDDTPIAVLSDKYRGLHHFFRQNFGQVTNPPIDSLRERHVMSLKTRFSNLANILDEKGQSAHVLVIDSPVLVGEDWDRLRAYFGDAVADIDCTFKVGGDASTLREAIARVRREAEDAVRAGRSELFLSDQAIGEGRVGMAMVLAAAAVHTHLVRKGLRSYASINVRSAEVLDTHAFAVLIGVGATTVHAYLAEAAIADRWTRGLFGGELSLADCQLRFRKAIDDGLLKIMAKMGIAVISSYRGGYNFEAVGLSRALVNDLFPGMPAKISGEGYQSLFINATEKHEAAFDARVTTLPIGGFYRQRAGGETHAYSAQLMHLLQTAVATDSYSTYLQFARGVADLPPVYLRDLMEFNYPVTGVALDSVEAITEIRKRFVTPGMSLGALSPEAHETLAIAMNRIGAKAVSGEGGEASERYQPYANGDNANSNIKQIASGRFGVTAEYLGACDEIEIKVAQGAKPGEGGQLPGFKVTEFIARLRHSTPGVMLISPPPHHDIYSIEDLAQLIYDLKQINPKARVCVKLVSSAGIGTVAAGVAKAHADVILVSGNTGGTGASPQT
ncbi:MAG: glutamate synthase large subunit, partial [Alphaproteobacteria bacterium]|nr:glutamate synthase large subunit [Alphaproteobacteria bacterium]